MNDVGFPVASRARRDRRGRGGRPAGEGQRGREARRQRRPGRRARPPLPRHAATSSASSSTWTSAPRTAGASTTSSRPPRSSRTIDAALPLEPAEENYRGEVARRWRYRDGSGEIGVIASVTQPFCGDCTRSRISAEGRLYTCLFATKGHDLRALVRAGADDAELHDTIGRIWGARTDRYSEERSVADGRPAARRDVLHRGLTPAAGPPCARHLAVLLSEEDESRCGVSRRRERARAAETPKWSPRRPRCRPSPAASLGAWPPAPRSTATRRRPGSPTAPAR